MSIQIYLKKGKRNYKENRILEKLGPIIEQKIKENPGIKFNPARDFEELKKLELEYTSEDTDIIYEETNNNKINNMAKRKDNYEDVDNENELNNDLDIKGFDDDNDGEQDFIDPFNREEPIVKSYVLQGSKLDKESETINESFEKSTFDEPDSFTEAFEIPGDNIEKNKVNQEKDKKQEKTEKQNINPSFDDMTGQRKKRSTKKFAKYIVEAVCMLSEKGFVWFANKDITEAKLTEYELQDVMDLSLLVNLEDGQEVTVKQFFQIQCSKADELSKISQEEKDDLADALAEVLLEKGVGPTPTQELILISLKIFGGQILTLMALKSQTGSLLTQLKAMKEQEKELAGDNYTQKPLSNETSTSTFEVEQQVGESISNQVEQNNLDKDNDILESLEPIMIGDSVNTKE